MGQDDDGPPANATAIMRDDRQGFTHGESYHHAPGETNRPFTNYYVIGWGGK